MKNNIVTGVKPNDLYVSQNDCHNKSDWHPSPTSITIHCYNIFLVMKNFKIDLLAKFQIHDSLSLTIVAMLFHPHGLFNL